MNLETAARLICNELARRTGYAAVNLGKGSIELTSPRRLEVRIIMPPGGPGRPIERVAENLLRRAGERGWHPTQG